MNYSIYSADRTTHLKIVIVALAASIGIASFGIAAHFKAEDQYSQTAYVVKAAKPSLRFAVALPARQDTCVRFDLCQWLASSLWCPN